MKTSPPLVHANVDELDAYESDNVDGIIAVADIPQQPPHAPLAINDTDDNDVGSDEDANDTESNDNKSDNKDDAESNDDKLSDSAATTDLDGNLTTAKNGSIKLNCYKSLKLLLQIAVLF